MTAYAVTWDFDPSVTTQQRQWVNDAFERCRFPMNRGSVTLRFITAAEPPCEGHKDYMCCQADGAGNALITIREGAEDPESPFNKGTTATEAGQLQAFFEESVIHEFGHAFIFNHMSLSDGDKTEIAGWFIHDVDGDRREGTLADWNPTDQPWADRIQEAIAEFFKDVYMPEGFRFYENRSNWIFQERYFGNFLDAIEAVTCAEGPIDT